VDARVLDASGSEQKFHDFSPLRFNESRKERLLDDLIYLLRCGLLVQGRIHTCFQYAAHRLFLSLNIP
jgi:hypothetical protein